MGDNCGLVVTGVAEGEAVVGIVDAAAAPGVGPLEVGTGVSLVGVDSSEEEIGSNVAWALVDDSVEWAVAGACAGVESRGCIRTNPKQNTDITTNGEPINKRCEPCVGPELSIL